MKLVQYDRYLVSTVVTDGFWLRTRTSVATFLSLHPCLSSLLWGPLLQNTTKKTRHMPETTPSWESRFDTKRVMVVWDRFMIPKEASGREHPKNMLALLCSLVELIYIYMIWLYIKTRSSVGTLIQQPRPCLFSLAITSEYSWVVFTLADISCVFYNVHNGAPR